MSGGIGPQIPADIAAKLGITQNPASQLQEEDHSSSDHEAIGPSMPPHAIGPSMPPHITGPAAPSTANPTSDSDSDSDLVGPSIALAGYTESDAAQQTLDTIESRMRRHDKTNQTPEEDKREEWMLLPPSVESTSAVRGSKAGKKGSMVAPLFDKSWTETPEERRARKKDKGKSGKRRETEVEEETPGMRKKRVEDEEKGRWVEEYNRTQRPKSLMEMHLLAKDEDRERDPKKRRGKDRESNRKKDGHRGEKRDRHGGGDEENDEEGDAWKRRRFDRSRDLSAGKVDVRKQRELLNTMGFLTDKYAPSKGGSFM
ncbi:hypothetical protein LPJ66_003272 [Kickxella alabastrina]|uniref:Uncharacterized protein n=1 Tax=Kickxella alabastrina TaxID=61397 RepID=A0ACC1IN96_9FUNG|nr:hypothetical protein LPJ66_003272 [Kickxella alabastrina]